MASTVSQNWLTITKKLKILNIRTIRFCSNFTSMCSEYLSNNVWRDFRLPISASIMVTQNA